MRGIVVTGATTPFGRALVAALLERGGVESVIAVGTERSWTGAADRRLDYVAIDLTRSRSLRDLLFGLARDRGADVVVGAAHHRSLRARGRRAHALNVGAIRELLALAERHPTIERMVYVGSSEIYRVDAELPALIAEDHPLDMSPRLPQRTRDRLEADLTVCARMGLSPLSIAVLRLSEIVAPESGSQLQDFLASRVCYRPLGHDPMLDVISIPDAVDAVVRACASDAQGVFNVPGADVLPLSVAIEKAGRLDVPVPSPLIAPLYAARAAVRGTEFTWSLGRQRLRFSGVLDGRRAAEVLGYRPRARIAWDRLGR